MKYALGLIIILVGLMTRANPEQTQFQRKTSIDNSNQRTKPNSLSPKSCDAIVLNGGPDDKSKSLIVPEYQQTQDEFDYQKLNKIIPTDLTPTNEPNKVFNKIADKSLNTIIASESFKSSSLGVMSERVKEKTKAEIKFNSDLNPSIQHQMKAELLPFQGETKLSYQGFFNLDLTFKSNPNDYELKLKEKLFNKEVFYQNQITKNSYSNQLGIQWDW